MRRNGVKPPIGNTSRNAGLDVGSDEQELLRLELRGERRVAHDALRARVEDALMMECQQCIVELLLVGGGYGGRVMESLGSKEALDAAVVAPNLHAGDGAEWRVMGDAWLRGVVL